MANSPRASIAIAGAGIGAEHLNALLTLEDGFRVAAICDRDLDRASALAERAGGCPIVSDLNDLLIMSDIDIVANCLPPLLHTETSIQLLNSGKHVVCEKPIATSIVDAERMQAAANAANRSLFPVFQYRYGNGLRQLQALIEAGLAGKPLIASAETHWDRDADYYSIPWRGTWRGEGGGAILSHAIHVHDLLMQVFGPVKTVSAMLTTLANPIEVDDCAALALQFEGDALATSSITLGAAENTTRLRFCFSHLTAENDGEPYNPGRLPWRFIARAPGTQELVDQTVADCQIEPDGFAGYYRALDLHLRGEDANFVSFLDGRRSIELVTALYRSAREGQIVPLPIQPEAADWTGWYRP